MDADSQANLVRLLREQRIASLGTLREGAPFVSLVLFAATDDCAAFYIHVSRLARHTQDMQKDARVSLLIAEREDDKGDPQQLARITIQARATMLMPSDAEYALAQRLYLAKHPQNAPLFEFKDFALYRIEAQRARYVAGFARAFNLDAEDLRRVAQAQ